MSLHLTYSTFLEAFPQKSQSGTRSFVFAPFRTHRRHNKASVLASSCNNVLFQEAVNKMQLARFHLLSSIHPFIFFCTQGCCGLLEPITSCQGEGIPSHSHIKRQTNTPFHTLTLEIICDYVRLLNLSRHQSMKQDL